MIKQINLCCLSPFFHLEKVTKSFFSFGIKVAQSSNWKKCYVTFSWGIRTDANLFVTEYISIYLNIGSCLAIFLSSRIFRKADGERWSQNLLFKQVFFVQKQDDGSVAEPLVVADGVKQLQAFLHTVLKQNLRFSWVFQSCLHWPSLWVEILPCQIPILSTNRFLCWIKYLTAGKSN